MEGDSASWMECGGEVRGVYNFILLEQRETDRDSFFFCGTCIQLNFNAYSDYNFANNYWD